MFNFDLNTNIPDPDREFNIVNDNVEKTYFVFLWEKVKIKQFTHIDRMYFYDYGNNCKISNEYAIEKIKEFYK